MGLLWESGKVRERGNHLPTQKHSVTCGPAQLRDATQKSAQAPKRSKLLTGGGKTQVRSGTISGRNRRTEENRSRRSLKWKQKYQEGGLAFHWRGYREQGKQKRRTSEQTQTGWVYNRKKGKR